jgi:hypothetical protein
VNYHLAVVRSAGSERRFAGLDIPAIDFNKLLDTRSVSAKSIRKANVASASDRSALSELSRALNRSVIVITQRADASTFFYVVFVRRGGGLA